MADAYIIDAVRTPRGIGKVGKGKLAHMHPQHLAAAVLKALKERNHIRTEEVDDIIWSTSTQKSTQSQDLGRMAALDAGYDVKASGVTLDRFCGGGITSVNFAAAQIMSGMEECVIAGGSEMIVRRQNIWRNSRRKLAECGLRLGVDVKRRACGVASADARWSVV